MTNKERLISLLGFAPDNNALDGTLLDAGIISSDSYVVGNIQALKKCAIELLELLLSTANTSFFNGATTASINYDRAMILKRIQIFKSELGIYDISATTTARAVRRW